MAKEVKKTSKPGATSKKSPAPKAQPMDSLSVRDNIHYMVEDAMRTIAKAEAHKRDRGLMREVKKLAKHTMKAVTK